MYPRQDTSLIYNPPMLAYCGITLVFSEKSRFDLQQLGDGPASQLINQSLAPYTRYHCDVRQVNEPRPYLPGTKVVILFGEKATKCYYFGMNNTLNNIRGYCYPVGDLSNPIVYIPTYNPQDCLDRRSYNSDGDIDDDEEDDSETGKEKEHSPTKRKNFKFWFYQDLQKASRIIKEGYRPELYTYKFETYLPAFQIVQILNSLKNETIHFDIETNDNYNITVFSFSCDSNNIVYTVPIWRYTSELAYTREETVAIWRALGTAFHHNRVVIHNSLFDLFILSWRYHIPPPVDIYDTMISWHRLNPEVEKSLGHVLSVSTQEVFHKNDGVFMPKNHQQELQLWQYNAKDVFGLSLAYKYIQREVSKAKLEDSVKRGNGFIRPYLLMSLMGMNLNTELIESKFSELERLKKQYLRISKHLIGYDIETLGSPKRIAQYLYEYKNLPKPNPTYENGVLTHEDQTASITLYKILTKKDIPFLKLLFAYRSIGKEAGFLKFVPWRNSRFTTIYSPAGTDTFRLNSRKLLSLWGGNAQNIKKKQRKVVVADPGKVLVQTDQSGAEALFVAYLAPKGKYRALMETGVKIHVFVALHVFQKQWEEILGKSISEFISATVYDLKKLSGWKDLENLIKDSDNWPGSRRYYAIAKMICHAANYGMKAPTFQLNVLKKSEGKIVLSLHEAQFYLGTYHELFTEIRQWHHLVRTQLEKDRTLYNAFGDRRIFYGQWDDSLFKQSYAFVPQSSVGVLTSVAISEIQLEIDRGNPDYQNIDILANGHDAILSQCPVGQEKQLAMIHEKHINKTFTLANGTFTMRSESSVGENWCEMKTIKYN